jgi:hypothetical protein
MKNKSQQYNNFNNIYHDDNNNNNKHKITKFTTLIPQNTIH